MNFNILEHLEVDTKGRSVCPSCRQSKGEGYSKRNLSVNLDNGAYHCFAGCTSEDIRAAIGQPKDKQIPSALAAPTASNLTSIDKVTEACKSLLKSKEPLEWLDNRGITPCMVRHYNLGLSRSLCNGKHLTSISIPFPSNSEGNYYIKKRVAPWMPESDRTEGYKPWSQYGIPSMVWFTHRPADPEETWICAGEWDAIRLGWLMRDQNSIAICTFTTGEGNVPKDKAELEKLQGELITFYDLDDAGTKGALKVQEAFRDRCRIARVPAPANPEKGFDVSNSLTEGFSIADFIEAAKKATAFSPPKKVNPLRARLVSNRELYDRAPDFVDFLVPDLLTENELFVVAGPPRGGKSLLAMTLAKAVATGSRFLDRPVMQGSVLYVNCEDSEAKIKQRQIAQQWDPDVPVWWIDRFKLSELEHLIDIASEVDDLRLIVLDTLSRVRDDGHNESSAELSRVLEPLQEMAKDLNVCILLTHHTGKIGEKDMADPFDLIRGSGAIRATCRGALILAPAENCYRLIAENGHTESLDLKIRINNDDWEWKLMGRWTPRISNDSFKEQVLDHLNLVGEATIPELVTELQISANTIKVLLWRLQSDDMVTKIGGKKGQPASYKRGNIRLHVTESVTEFSPDGERDRGDSVTNNKFTISTEKVIIDEKVITEISPMITFGQNDHLSPSTFPCNRIGAMQYPESVSGDFDKVTCNRIGDHRNNSVTNPKVIIDPSKVIIDPSKVIIDPSKVIIEGAKVIIGTGRFYGKPADVISITPEGQVEVKADGWYVSQKYPPDQLQLIVDEPGEVQNNE
jgi:AAA domain